MDLLHHRLTLERIRLAAKRIDKVFLNSPQYNCEPLSMELGTELFLKVETMNPIRSFKGRGADFLLDQCKAQESLVCASAGNFGQAMAYACRNRGVKLTVFASTTANPLKIERMRALGAIVTLKGEDFDAAKVEGRAYASNHNLRFVEDGLDPETAEGAGTIGLELQQMENLHAVFIPVGNGALFNGIARVFKELSPSTKMIAVQAEGAPAMIETLSAGKIRTHPKISTIADGIGVRIPVPQAVEDMRLLVDEMILVSDEEILAAMKTVHFHAGMVAEPSAVVGIAAIRKKRETLKGQRVATIICGGNLTQTQMNSWLS